MAAAGIERSASITGNGTKLLNDTWLGDKLGFSQKKFAHGTVGLVRNLCDVYRNRGNAG